MMRIKDVCDTTSGGTPLRDTHEYYDAGTVPWVKSGELRDGPIYETAEKITERGVKESSAKVFPSGTLLIALYGATVGRLGVLKVEAATNQAVCAIFANHQVDRDYLFYYLLKQRDHLIDSRTGGAQPNISQDTIRNLPIPLPPLPEQQRIAAILERADRLRRLRRYALELSEGYLQAVFVEMFGDPVRNPKGWPRAKVAELGEVQTGNTPSRERPEYYGGHIEWIKSDNILDDQMYVSPSRELLSEQGERQGRVVDSGALLVTCIAGSLSSVGSAALTNRRVAFNQQINAVTQRRDVSSLFLYGLFRIAQPFVQQNASAGMKHIITKSKLEELTLIKPPLSLQEKFGQVAQKHERLRAQQREAARQAEQLFGALLDRAFRDEL
jgi:type I restriction enzyme S subunit